MTPLLLAAIGALTVVAIVPPARPPIRRPTDSTTTIDPDPDPPRRRRTGPPPTVVGLLVALIFATALGGPVIGLVVICATAGAQPTRSVLDRRRSQVAVQRDLPEALDHFVLLLQAGATPRHAIAELAHRGPASTRSGFAHVVDQLERGHPLSEAITALRAHLGHGSAALVDLVAGSDRSGLPMAAVITELSNESRAARRRRNDAAARALPVKLSFPLVVCTLPSFVLLAIAPAVMAALSSLGSNAW